MTATFGSVGDVAKLLGISPSYIRALTDRGVFAAKRTRGGHRRYDLAATQAAWVRHRLALAGVTAGDALVESVLADALPEPTFDVTFPLVGLAEDRVWSAVREALDLPAGQHVTTLAAYAFTVMLNNAIDHSRGSEVHVTAGRHNGVVSIEIRDDGRGVFAHLAAGLGLPDLFASIQELTKGRRTTDPRRHTGEGIFFTSKAVDIFHLASNGITWTVDNLRSDHAVGVSPVATGTLVRLQLDEATTRELSDLFREFTEDSRFTRTRPVVKLFGIGVTFVSRSEAKRLLEGLDKFSEVEVDFTGVESVGQGFIDELLRVWPTDHPGTRLIPTGMNEAVAFMVERGTAPLIEHSDDDAS